MEQRMPYLTKFTYLLLFIVLLVYSLTVAMDILSPIVLAIIFSYLILPVVQFFDRHHFRRALSILLSILLLIIIISIILFVLYKSISNLMGDLPSLQEKAYANIDKLGLFIQDTFGWTIEKQKLYIKDGISNLFKGSNDIIGSIFQATGATFFKMCVIPVLMFYMLDYRHHIGVSIRKAVPNRYKDEANDIIKRVSFITPRYLAGVFTVVITLSILNSLGLYIVGLEHPVAFGIISAIFTFVPYFGVWIGAIIPISFALITGTPQLALGVVLVYLVAMFLENNVLTPNITGRYVHINPLFTILLIIIGGLIWGLIGMFVILPVMAIVKIIFEHFDSTKPYAFLLGTNIQRKPRWFIDMKKLFRVSRKK